MSHSHLNCFMTFLIEMHIDLNRHKRDIGFSSCSTAGLAQSIERLTAKRAEVAGSIPGAGSILRVVKYLRKEGTAFALQTAIPWGA